MSDRNTKKNKHMTLEDRLEIQGCLDHGMTFKAIAKRVGKDQTTISKDVKKHIFVNPEQIDRNGKSNANELCPKLLKAPFVCNSCQKKGYYCSFRKQYYNAKKAQDEYESLLSESREGIPLNKEAFYEVDKILSDGIKRGQHLYHVLRTNNLGISHATAYRHLHRGYLSVSKTDFPRVVKFKQRRQRQPDYIPKAVKAGKTYEDFLEYIDEKKITDWVEMDTVIGRIGGKVIMTFDFTVCNFMFGLLLDDKTAAEAAQKIRGLKEKMAADSIRFGDVCPLLLTDNGGEFANISAFMADLNGELETKLFFCDPMQSCQKPRVEKNHTLFRDIVPKGESFDSFSQTDINFIFSHVNGVKRKKFNGKSPYDLFEFIYGEKIASLFGISNVPPNDVLQSPKLLRQIPSAVSKHNAQPTAGTPECAVNGCGQA